MIVTARGVKKFSATVFYVFVTLYNSKTVRCPHHSFTRYKGRWFPLYYSKPIPCKSGRFPKKRYYPSVNFHWFFTDSKPGESTDIIWRFGFRTGKPERDRIRTSITHSQRESVRVPPNENQLVSIVSTELTDDDNDDGSLKFRQLGWAERSSRPCVHLCLGMLC